MREMLAKLMNLGNIYHTANLICQFCFKSKIMTTHDCTSSVCMVNIHMCGVMSVLKLRYFKLLINLVIICNGLLTTNEKVPASVNV